MVAIAVNQLTPNRIGYGFQTLIRVGVNFLHKNFIFYPNIELLSKNKLNVLAINKSFGLF